MSKEQLGRVLECCSFNWQRHKDIATEYDRRFPPQWHNFLRRLYLRLDAGPTVLLYFDLDNLEKAGLVEIKVQRENVIDAMSGRSYKLDLPYYRRKAGGKRVPLKQENIQPAFVPA